MKFPFSTVLPAGLVMLLAACGSISTNTLQPTMGPAPQSRPERIVVLPFDTTDCTWALEVSSSEESMIKNGFPERLTSAVAVELNKIAPTTVAADPDSGNCWVIQGRLHRVLLPDPGVTDSKRKPVVECTVFVFDLKRSKVQPFLTYDIKAKDVYADPLADPLTQDKTYLSLEASETARLLTQSVKDYLKSRGWSDKR